MWTTHSPTDRQLLAARLRQSRMPLSYASVGCTRSSLPPAGFVVDHHRVRLGDGDEVFTRAKESLRRWAQFPSAWTWISPDDAPIRAGTVLTVTARVFGLYWVNALRIVEVIDEPRRFGFAYGTLPGHVETGEERFVVEIDAAGGVWYDLLAHSRPRFWLTRLFHPLARRVQKRFALDSLAAMTQAVRVGEPVLCG